MVIKKIKGPLLWMIYFDLKNKFIVRFGQNQDVLTVVSEFSKVCVATQIPDRNYEIAWWIKQIMFSIMLAPVCLKPYRNVGKPSGSHSSHLYLSRNFLIKTKKNTSSYSRKIIYQISNYIYKPYQIMKNIIFVWLKATHKILELYGNLFWEKIMFPREERRKRLTKKGYLCSASNTRGQNCTLKIYWVFFIGKNELLHT